MLASLQLSTGLIAESSHSKGVYKLSSRVHVLHIPVDFGKTEPIPTTQIDSFYTGPCHILFDDETRGTRVRKEIRQIALQVNIFNRFIFT